MDPENPTRFVPIMFSSSSVEYRHGPWNSRVGPRQELPNHLGPVCQGDEDNTGSEKEEREGGENPREFSIRTWGLTF